MLRKRGNNSEISDPSEETSPSSFEAQREKKSSRIGSYLLFTFVSISLVLTIGSLCILFTGKETYLSGPQSSSPKTEGGSSQNISSTQKLPSQKPKDKRETVPRKIDPEYTTPTKDGPNVESVIEKETLTTDVDLFQLQIANSKIEKEPEEAKEMFLEYLNENPESIEAMFGYAKSLEKISEMDQSFPTKKKAIETFKAVVNLGAQNQDKSLDQFIKEAGMKCVELMGTKGNLFKPIDVLEQLIELFPNDTQIQNELGSILLKKNKKKYAKEVFQKTLEIDPNNNYALVQYGLLCKTEDQDYRKAAEHMSKALENDAKEANNTKFHIHLGDSYLRLGEREKAYKVYEEGVRKGMFLSKHQRSLHNVDRLKAQPLWTLEETTYEEFFRSVERNWQKILEEALNAMAIKGRSGFFVEREKLSDTGTWKQFVLYQRGRELEKNCKHAPFTCDFFRNFTAATTCKRGQVKFSLMEPGTHVFPHTGPTNCRLRAHLGLLTPEGASMRMVDHTITWDEGKVLVIDDSFEHEVWHHGTSPRLVLIIDFWHPEITLEERKKLKAM